MLEDKTQRTEPIDPLEAYCREYEAAWQADKRPDIGAFLDRVEDEQKGPLLARLVLLDFAQRRRFGDTPLAAQYKARFPEYSQAIDEALASEDTQTKSLAVTTPHVASPPERHESSSQPPAKDRQHPSVDRFIKSLTDCGLMSREEIEAFLDGLSAAGRPTDAKQLAEALYRQKTLTKFQVQAIYQGKTRGLVVGNYIVLDRLGKGGMGQVYKARHRVMERIVALKVLPSQSTKSEESVKRFHREVRAAARLSHANIVTAFDADEAKGVHFLVMEYAEGQDLAALVKERGPLSVRQAVNSILQAARGLEYAHKQGVVHRDIKPHNLLMDRQGTVKVLDMGLARIEQEMGDADAASDDGLTQSGQVMGTLDFMSPEQTLDTKTADARSDVYSLGCTLFYLLTRRPPYPADTFAKRILAHRNDPIPSLRAERPDVPESLDRVFQKTLAKRPEDRQQTMTELIGELEGCLAERSLEAQADSHPATASLIPASSPPAYEEPDLLSLNESLMNQPVELTERFIAPSLQPPLSRLRKPQNRRRKYRTLLTAIGLAGIFGLLFLGIMIALRSPEGTLIVEVNEPGAKVQVLDADGKVEIERTSSGEKLSFSLQPGKRQIRVERNGFAFFTKEFTLESRGEVVVKARLEPLPAKPGTLRLTVSEQDAQVEVLDAEGKVDSRYRSGADELTIRLAAGNYQIRVEKPGYERYGTTVALAPGADHPLDVTLAAVAHPEEPTAASATMPANKATAESVENVSASAPAQPLRIVRTGPEPPPAVAPFDAEQARKHQEAWAAHLGVPVEWTNSIGMKFMLIPPGEFMMGSTVEEKARFQEDALEEGTANKRPLINEGQPQRVSITRPFCLGCHEVTRGQFRRFVTETGYKTEAERDGKGGRGVVYGKWVEGPQLVWHAHLASPQTDEDPVVLVTWNDAVAFCRWLSDKEGLEYVLPDEAQWEYACRAGTTTVWHCGDDEAALPEHAWFGKSFVGKTRAVGKEHPVGRLQSNAFGLFDMHGNVWEWCSEAHAAEYSVPSAVKDGGDTPDDLLRVNRGGSWRLRPWHCRSARRILSSPVYRRNDIGFRVAHVPQEQATAKENPVLPAAVPQDITTGTQSEETKSSSTPVQPPRIVRSGPEPPPAVAPFDAEQARAHQEAWAAHLGVPVEWTNSIGMQFVLIPPGEFMMGSSEEEVADLLKEAKRQQADPRYFERVPRETPKHRVKITKPFYLAVFEVTQFQYEKVMNTNPCQFQSDTNRPVEQVTWLETVEFCRRLGQLNENNTPAARYQLPTEAQWEYACRAGTAGRYCFGDDSSSLSEYAWWNSNSSQSTWPVGQKKPNAFGLFDMHGNVWEWCADWYGQEYYAVSPVDDPSGPAAGTSRVIRGGSRITPNPGQLRCAWRGAYGPEHQDKSTGFRVALIPEEQAITKNNRVLPRVVPQDTTTGTQSEESKSQPTPAHTLRIVRSGPEPPPAIAPFDAEQARKHQEAWAAHLGVPVEWTNSIGMKFVLIPPGEFMMGSTEDEIERLIAAENSKPEPSRWLLNRLKGETRKHHVTIATPFYLGATEVTQEHFIHVMRSNPSRHQGDPQRPADRVTWHSAVEFSRTLSQVSGDDGDANVYRLPNEAEWEYACRAGTTTRYSWGDDQAVLLEYAWTSTNSFLLIMLPRRPNWSTTSGGRRSDKFKAAAFRLRAVVKLA